MQTAARLATILLLVPYPAAAHPAAGQAGPAEALAIGDTFTLPSAVLDETRRINVYAPPACVASKDTRLPVLYIARDLAEVFAAHAPVSLAWHYELLADETHATIYHPAVLRALRRLFAPQ